MRFLTVKIMSDFEFGQVTCILSSIFFTEQFYSTLFKRKATPFKTNFP